MGSAHGYRYVGPAGLAERASPGPDVITVTSAQALARWLAGRPADEPGEPFTFVRCCSRAKGPGGWSASSATSPPVTARIRIHGQRLPRRWTGSAWRTPAVFTHKFVFRRCPTNSYSPESCSGDQTCDRPTSSVAQQIAKSTTARFGT